MKYSIGEILYFKPSYNEQIKYCRICQIVKFLEDKNQYLVIASDIYCPYHYCKCFIREEDLDYINNTFLVKEVTPSNLFVNLSIEEVIKLPFYDIYKEIK